MLNAKKKASKHVKLLLILQTILCVNPDITKHYIHVKSFYRVKRCVIDIFKGRNSKRKQVL